MPRFLLDMHPPGLDPIQEVARRRFTLLLGVWAATVSLCACISRQPAAGSPSTDAHPATDRQLDGGEPSRCAAGQWRPLIQGAKYSLTGIWGSSAGDIFAVGGQGTIMHFDGSGWLPMTSGTEANLVDVWGSSGKDVFTVGAKGAANEGVVFHYDGAAWVGMKLPSGLSSLMAVHGSGPNDVHAMGLGTVLHYDGKAWTATYQAPSTQILSGIWSAGPTAAFAVGTEGKGIISSMLLSYDGKQWASQPLNMKQALSIWGRSATDVYVGGLYGAVLHFDGSKWTQQTITTDVNLRFTRLWGYGPSEVYARGEWGELWRFNGKQWSFLAKLPSGEGGMWGPAPGILYSPGPDSIQRFDGTTSTPQSTDAWLRAAWTDGSVTFAVGSGGAIISREGTKWHMWTSGCKADLYGVWGANSAEVYAVGDSGTILRFDGTAWKALASGTTSDLRAVWGSGAGEIFAVGAGGMALQYDGASWRSIATDTKQALYSVWGSGPGQAMAVGWSGTILRFDGVRWRAMASGTSSPLYSVWGARPDLVYAAGPSGDLLRFNGTRWEQLSTSGHAPIYAIGGVGPADTFFAGPGGGLFHMRDQGWTPMKSPTTLALSVLALSGLAGTLQGGMYAVGQQGTVLHLLCQ